MLSFKWQYNVWYYKAKEIMEYKVNRLYGISRKKDKTRDNPQPVDIDASERSEASAYKTHSVP